MRIMLSPLSSCFSYIQWLVVSSNLLWFILDTIVPFCLRSFIPSVHLLFEMFLVMFLYPRLFFTHVIILSIIKLNNIGLSEFPCQIFFPAGFFLINGYCICIINTNIYFDWPRAVQRVVMSIPMRSALILLIANN